MIESPTARANSKTAATFIADTLWNAGARTTGALDCLSDDDWTLAATTARAIENIQAAAENRKPRWKPVPGYCPSIHTRRRVATIISYWARTAAAPEVDPFDGLPT